MQSPRLLLVRHGRTAWNVERRFLGRTDIPLDDVGLDQAARLGRRLSAVPLAGIWSSPLSRARQTAAAVGAPLPEADLVEMDMGELEGLSGPEFNTRYPELVAEWRVAPHAVALPGGERVEDVQARAVRAFERIARALSPGQTALVVTHQIVLATAVCHWNGAPLEKFRTWMHRNTGITTVEFTDRARILSFDDAAHLES